MLFLSFFISTINRTRCTKHKIIKMEQIKLLKNLFATLVFVLVVTFVPFVFGPIYILRYVLSKLSFLGPNLGDILCPGSTVLATDNIYSKPVFNILLSTTLKGDSSNLVDFARDVSLDKIINARSDNGKLKYPESKQYPYRWMGFFFWKWDEGFDISNHIKMYSPSESNGNTKVSQEQLREIEQTLLLKPFEKNRSPWEILVIRNVEADTDNGEIHSVVFFRIHHVMGDGFSMMKINYLAFLDNRETTITNFLDSQAPNNMQLRRLCKSIILAPYEFIQYNLESQDKNEWTLQDNKNKTNIISSVSKNSLKELKEIRKFHQVGLSAVIYAGLTAALRKAFLRRNENVPNNVHLLVPLPMPGHPDKLTIHRAVVSIRLPVGEPDPVKRLHKINSNFMKLKTSHFPAIAFYIVAPLVENLFPAMIKYLMKKGFLVTGLSSSFPGPKKTNYAGNLEVVDSHFFIGPTNMDSVVGFNTLSYCDVLRLTLMTNNIFENKEELEDAMKDIHKEFRILKKCEF